ncbi:tolloid-like protein 2 [Sitodiplosis mosellana]|uniref:tolloid-like protein 2 n=1 Tax=Sitodiplosis mosellana TaxID=263140 RepID=UPI0024451D5D|nr:tolloid-like protein 2 [Sitodiplosis mosellana]
MECKYLIKLPRNSETRVKISFLSFELEGGDEGSISCSYDYVEIYEGHDDKAPKVGRWCGSRLPPQYSSLSNEIFVVFRTDSSRHFGGFHLKYETDCGGKYQDDNGIITSPFYPSPYDEDKNCIYDIEAPLGKAIILNFTNFDIEADCDFDSLRIYDGFDSNATLIGTYCGNEKPLPVTSKMNHLHLIFSTDRYDTGQGFKASYTFIDTNCGGFITTPNVTISPSLESGKYLHRANCRWFIIAPPGFLVQLRFTSFDLEGHGCEYDYVEIFDDIVTNGTNAAAFGKFCGAEVPRAIRSTSRALTMVFKSDETDTGEGFVATYDFLDGRNFCGGNFFSLTDTITSPNYPENYPGNKDCVYIINAPRGKQIELKIEAFDLEDRTGCIYDSLEIRNGASDKSPLIGTFCGTDILPRYVSSSNHMYLRFKSDSSDHYGGFQISYDTARSGCGGMFTNAQSGTISSPNYPQPYPADMQCDYSIQVARGSTIKLVVTDLIMETSLDCSYDYIAIHDGPNAGSKLLGIYCHQYRIVFKQYFHSNGYR